MAESVDALVSNTNEVTLVPVRLRLWVRPKKLLLQKKGLFLCLPLVLKKADTNSADWVKRGIDRSKGVLNYLKGTALLNSGDIHRFGLVREKQCHKEADRLAEFSGRIPFLNSHGSQVLHFLPMTL